MVKTKLKSFILSIKNFVISLGEDNVSAFAAKSSYFLILTLFPFIMLLLTLIKYTPLTENDLIFYISRVTPNYLDPLIDNMINEMYGRANGAIISITAITAIWSASKGVLAIKTGLNAVYHAKEARNYFLLRLMSAFYTIILLLAILFTLSLLVFGNSLYRLISKELPFVEDIFNVFLNLRFFISLLILTLFFIFLYMVMPNIKVTLFNALPGSIFSAIGWMIFSSAFSFYIDNMGRYSYVYGSLTTVVLLMLWTYICMYIMFIGAAINLHLKKHIDSYIDFKKSM